jgi:pimeloyl-ACP methyl ester carboxylesterase
MIVVVDGTGEASNDAYAKEMRNSFCSQIASVAGATYFRGPTLTGSEVSAIADRAAAAAQTLEKSGRPIMLAGYSRGGCAAILAAKRLKASGRRVKALFLFDPVDMQISDKSLSQTIPDNVDYVARARTARDVAFWLTNPVKSRFYFYNTGRWLAGAGQFDHEAFVGSHGALGGVPWPDVVGDAACALKVAAWMSPKLQAQGLNVALGV